MTKAVVIEKIGLIQFREIDEHDVYQPTPEEEEAHGTKVVARQLGEPAAHEIEVEAVCGAVCTHEVSLFTGDLTHPRYPMIPGHEAVHRVLKLGTEVKNLNVGDYVSCCWYMGQWSRKLIGPANLAYKLTKPMDDPANWIIEPAASVVNAISYMDLKPGHRVLLIGAGFMGLLIIQLLHNYPLETLDVADVKPYNLDLALECGADHVIKNGKLADSNDLRQLIYKKYDRVIECSGSQSGLDLAVGSCDMAGHIYLFGWHRQIRHIDLKNGHLRGQALFHTSPAIDFGNQYERYWPMTINLFNKGKFNLHKLITHKYKAEDIDQAMRDSVERKNGFVKSVIYFE